MITAVLYSGQARTIAQCLPTQHWAVFRHFPDLHFFVLWQNDAHAVEGVRLLEERYGKERVHSKLIDDPTDLPMIPLKLGAHAPYANAAQHPNLLMQHWYQWKVWERFTQWPDFDKVSLVMRMRGDNWFKEFRMSTWNDNAVYTPWWGTFGGVNDRFAIMNRKYGESYFAVYPMIEKLMADGCPFHPESLLKARMELGQTRITETLWAIFDTARMDGTRREPEILNVDFARYLRGH